MPDNVETPWVKILVALISVTGIIIVGYWQFRQNPKDNLPKLIRYIGTVREEGTNKPVHQAKVTIEQDQKEPERTYSDSDGVFRANLPENISSVHVIVEADGYVFFDRNVSVTRTGLELIFITPMKKSFGITRPKNPKLFELIQDLREIRNVKIDFSPNCTQKVRQAVVEFNGGQITGVDVKDFLEKIRARTKVNFSVNSIKEESYEITCQ